jgi:hypothetical protein
MPVAASLCFKSRLFDYSLGSIKSSLVLIKTVLSSTSRPQSTLCICPLRFPLPLFLLSIVAVS